MRGLLRYRRLPISTARASTGSSSCAELLAYGVSFVMSTRSTYTYAILEVSAPVYEEIRKKLAAAGYGDQFGKDDGAEVIDMHGIALKAVGGGRIQRGAERSGLSDIASTARSKF